MEVVMRRILAVFAVLGMFVVLDAQPEGGRLTSNNPLLLQTLLEANLSMADWSLVITHAIGDTGVVSTVYGDTVRVKGAYNSSDTVQTLVCTFIGAPATNVTFRVAPLSFLGKLPSLYRVRMGTSSGMLLFLQKKLPTAQIY